jgi:NAD(P)-dependent dehydrogenase (short-subunit alcohol dehydrogenase family)
MSYDSALADKNLALCGTSKLEPIHALRPTMDSFSDATALVTGGAAGIGRDVALALGEAGAAVVVADIDGDGAEATATRIERETSGIATPVRTDVADEDSVAALVETTVETYGGLDVAVNNAGITGEQAYVGEYDSAEFERVLDVNLSGVFYCLKHELAAMDEGSIVNVASVLGQVGFERAAPYVAAKHGVVGLTRTAAMEYADRGVRVNAVAPGFTDTGMLDDAGVTASEQTEASVRGLHPMGRFGESEEIADAICWLCSAEASYVTGTVLPVDGGYTSR